MIQINRYIVFYTMYHLHFIDNLFLLHFPVHVIFIVWDEMYGIPL